MMNSNPPDVAIEIEAMLDVAASPIETNGASIGYPRTSAKQTKMHIPLRPFPLALFTMAMRGCKTCKLTKLVYFKKFIQRNNTNLHELVSFIENLEPSIRRCYSEDIKSDKHSFVKILLLDSCFIIELFLRSHANIWPKEDPRSPDTRLSDIIQLDLLLLENQLPFFVLEKIFDKACHSHISSGIPSFLELMFNYFNSFNKQELRADQDVNVWHFHLQKPPRPRRVMDVEVLQFTVKDLNEAGLKFKVNNKSQCLLRLQFSGQALEIPQIVVEDRTEVLFHNMVAFEQCHCPYESYITDYVTVFDFLIDTGKDVFVLVQSGVIVNYLDDNEAMARLF